MQIASLGNTILVAQMSGDRPAMITKVLTNAVVEACGFFPEPLPLDRVTIHPTRAEAINAGQQDRGWHGYWKA